MAHAAHVAGGHGAAAGCALLLAAEQRVGAGAEPVHAVGVGPADDSSRSEVAGLLGGVRRFGLERVEPAVLAAAGGGRGARDDGGCEAHSG